MQIPPPNSPPPNFEVVTPITVVTGGLGVGKTSLIRNWAKSLTEQGQRLVYLKNEIGDIDLDVALLSKQSVATELLTGCVCCTIVGPFVEELSRIHHTYHPDRIIVETSGLAEPANLVVTLNGITGMVRDGLIGVIDAKLTLEAPAINDVYQRQAKLTDLLIITKHEGLDASAKQQVLETIKLSNAYAPVIWADGSRVPVDLVVGLPPRTEIGLSARHHHEGMEVLTLIPPEIMDRKQLERWLETVPEGVMRIKGFVKTPEPMIINQAYRRLGLFPTTIVHPTGIQVIGLGITHLKPQLQHQLERCALT